MKLTKLETKTLEKFKAKFGDLGGLYVLRCDSCLKVRTQYELEAGPCCGGNRFSPARLSYWERWYWGIRAWL
jgi:hypothetical protein